MPAQFNEWWGGGIGRFGTTNTQTVVSRDKKIHVVYHRLKARLRPNLFEDYKLRTLHGKILALKRDSYFSGIAFLRFKTAEEAHTIAKAERVEIAGRSVRARMRGVLCAGPLVLPLLLPSLNFV